MDNQCSKCGAHCSQTVELDNRVLLDCDRCGFVGLPGQGIQTTPEPAPKTRNSSTRHPLFGWGSAAFVTCCLGLGSAIFGFLYYTGQGWTHPKAAPIQTALCDLTLCTEYQQTEVVKRWQINQINIQPVADSSSRITARLMALNSELAPPALELVVTDLLGDQRRRLFQPDEYLLGRSIDQIELNFALEPSLISQAEFLIADAPSKTQGNNP